MDAEQGLVRVAANRLESAGWRGGGGEPSDLLADFQKQTGVSFPIVRDPNETLRKFAFPQGVGYPYPRDVVIDKNLVVRDIKNSFNAAEMDKLVSSLLAE